MEKDKIEAKRTEPIRYFFNCTPAFYHTIHWVFQIYEIKYPAGIFIVVEVVFLHIPKKT